MPSAVTLQQDAVCWSAAALACYCLADDKGRLVKATRLKGIQHFKASQYGLHPIAVQAWGHFVFLHLNGGRPAPAQQIVRAATTGRQNSIQHAASPPSVEAWLGM
eukprot:GHRR01018274.1.p3 GENE.GHRR01018274.1~~GHRR01018274.1.p3  ORF type:complete len:105 (+),score=30.94 GHRR01018274.1:744-1058(+)